MLQYTCTNEESCCTRWHTQSTSESFVSSNNLSIIEPQRKNQHIQAYGIYIYRVCHTRNKVHTHILRNILKPHVYLTNLNVWVSLQVHHPQWWMICSSHHEPSQWLLCSMTEIVSLTKCLLTLTLMFWTIYFFHLLIIYMPFFSW